MNPKTITLVPTAVVQELGGTTSSCSSIYFLLMMTEGYKLNILLRYKLILKMSKHIQPIIAHERIKTFLI